MFRTSFQIIVFTIKAWVLQALKILKLEEQVVEYVHL